MTRTEIYSPAAPLPPPSSSSPGGAPHTSPNSFLDHAITVTALSMLGTRKTKAGKPDTSPNNRKLPTISVASEPTTYPTTDDVA
mmetsp:Transcript_32292/g.67720  ORF Transcript_32292/g.67720 Transcript_32292/m.67720 type:complete len:84 (-) Transcript_32292:1893-2144(-)